VECGEIGIRIHPEDAERRLGAAVDMARDKTVTLPSEWLERTHEVGKSTNRTFVAMLGTALLAKATDGTADTLAIKANSGDRAYSARSLCHNVLVPAAVKFGFHLGATGREPLNNQPFFRYNRVDEIERVMDRPSLDYLTRCLQLADRLDPEQAIRAFAAFLKVRTDIAAQARQLTLEKLDWNIDELVESTGRFLEEDAEGGRRGQAFVAAVFDLVFDQVRTSRVNDPSRRMPGDVQALRGNWVTLVAEARQKPVTESEVLQFASSLGAAGVRRGMVAALARNQPPLDVAALRRAAWRQHKVMMTIMVGVPEVLLGALSWGSHLLEEQLAEFPIRMLRRMEELEVSEAGQQSWTRLRSLREKTDGSSEQQEPEL
jgi:hypothetical protein